MFRVAKRHNRIFARWLLSEPEEKEENHENAAAIIAYSHNFEYVHMYALWMDINFRFMN